MVFTVQSDVGCQSILLLFNLLVEYRIRDWRCSVQINLDIDPSETGYTHDYIGISAIDTQAALHGVNSETFR